MVVFYLIELLIWLCGFSELRARECMGLAEALVGIPQSERGGEIAQRGFDYQTCWALSQMLEYEPGQDHERFINKFRTL